MSELVKESNFIKQVERTAKADAYETALDYLKNCNFEDAIRIIESKAKGHREFLNSLPTKYNYAWQTLVPKKKSK